MKNVHLLVLCAIAASFIKLCSPLKIVVYNNSQEINSYKDESAYMNDQSYNIPSVEVTGILVYPVPHNACSTVQTLPDDFPYFVFAYVSDYAACPGQNEINLYRAGYQVMITSEDRSQNKLAIYEGLPQAMVSQDFAAYLEEYVLPFSSYNDSTMVIGISESYFQLYEKLLLIFGGVLSFAIFIALCLFCCSLMCRQGWHKWKTRGLTRWRVRQLPRRKYCGSKEVNETCSICLDDFNEGETIRVLPCEHVFHPKCVDEWLQKWNRTCPLCKVPISRSRSRNGEHERLISSGDEDTISTESNGDNGRNYGAVDTGTGTMDTGTGTVGTGMETMDTGTGTMGSTLEEDDLLEIVTEPPTDSAHTQEPT